MRILLTLFTTFAVLMTTLASQVSHAQNTVAKEGAYSISSYETKFGIGVSVFRGKETQPIDKISYTGDCKKYPIIYAYLWPAHSTLKTFEKSGDYHDFNMGQPTEIFTRELSKQCPNVTDIKIKLGRGDRLVVASLAKTSGWKNTLGKLTAEEAANPDTKPLKKTPILTLAQEAKKKVKVVNTLDDLEIEVLKLSKFGLELVDRINSSNEAKLGMLNALKKLSSDVDNAKTAKPKALQCYALNIIKIGTINMPNRIQLLSLDAKSYGGISKQDQRTLEILKESVKAVKQSLDRIRTALGCNDS